MTDAANFHSLHKGKTTRCSASPPRLGLGSACRRSAPPFRIFPQILLQAAQEGPLADLAGAAFTAHPRVGGRGGGGERHGLQAPEADVERVAGGQVGG